MVGQEQVSLSSVKPLWEFQEHLGRYQFASRFLRERVLDVACGAGYGAFYLRSHGANETVGCDISRTSVREANSRFGSIHTHFLVADGTSLPFRDGTFDGLVSLETIEHIHDDHAFVRECIRVLDRAGTSVFSTPNKTYDLRNGEFFPYHVREYSLKELVEALGELEVVEIWGTEGRGNSHPNLKRAATRGFFALAKIQPSLRDIIKRFLFATGKIRGVKYYRMDEIELNSVPELRAYRIPSAIATMPSHFIVIAKLPNNREY